MYDPQHFTLDLDLCSIFLCAVLKLIFQDVLLPLTLCSFFLPLFQCQFPPVFSAPTFPFILYKHLLLYTFLSIHFIRGFQTFQNQHTQYLQSYITGCYQLLLLVSGLLHQTSCCSTARCTVVDKRACDWGMTATSTKSPEQRTVKGFYFCSHWSLQYTQNCSFTVSAILFKEKLHLYWDT